MARWQRMGCGCCVMGKAGCLMAGWMLEGWAMGQSRLVDRWVDGQDSKWVMEKRVNRRRNSLGGCPVKEQMNRQIE